VAEPPPHVALLTTTLDVSGAERVLALVADGLARAGFRVSVVGLQRRSGALAALITDPAVHVTDVGLTGAWDAAVVTRLSRWLQAEQVSVLYTFLFHATVLGRLAGRRARVPVVLSSQQVAAWGGPLRFALERWTARWCDRIVAVSPSVRDDLVTRYRFPADRIRVIANAIDVSSFVPSRAAFDGAAGVVIGSASRLAPEKDHETLIHGFALARAVRGDLQLQLAGSGPLEARLRALIADLKLENCAHMLGRVEAIRRFYNGLDVYVQPSRAEGLPCAVVEAMAMGRPVLATDVPGNRDVVVDGVTGRLIAAGSPVAWRDAILAIAADPAAAQRSGEAGRRRAAALFDAPSMIAATVALINELLASPTRRPVRPTGQ
jgi:glycosyltransferase involved in cell wall biosynthesis